MNHLFLVSVGPIQDFIASARRSRDLWFGSWLLSELAKSAARFIYEQRGKLIFPAPQDPTVDLATGSRLNVANKIVATVELSPEQVYAFGNAIESAIQQELDRIRTEAYRSIHGRFDSKNAERQVADLVEYYWVALPLSSQEKYSETRRMLEALMAARKVTRNFPPVKPHPDGWGSSRPKSSLDGQRESVIPEGAYLRRDDPERTQKIKDLYRNYRAGQAEQLSGVDLLKRHGNRGSEAHFLSTSHIAALPFLKGLEDVDRTIAKEAWKQYAEALIKLEAEREEIGKRFPEHPVIGQYDGAVLYEERLSDLLRDPPRSYLESARQELQRFLSKTVGNAMRPMPYYALLLADGDNMGKVIDAQTHIGDGMQRHQDLSQALSEFARGVQAIVEEKYRGALIYAGGDDVLALLPLHTVLGCARELAREFRTSMKGFTARDKQSNAEITPTLSVGIAVSHHIEPLSDALDLARQSEKHAKGVPGKDALAVILSKRSGVDRSVVGRWGTLDERLERFVRSHRDEAIPDGAAYELHNLFLRVGRTLPKDALQGEAIRILKRKRTQRGGKKMDEALSQAEGSTFQYLESIVKGSGITLEQLANELIVARIFADADKLAYSDTAKSENKEQP